MTDGPSPRRAGGVSNVETDAFIAQGNALEDEGKVADAFDWYRRALAAAPSYAKAHMNAGNALQKLGRFDEAMLATREAARCAPDSSSAHFNLGTLLRTAGDYSAAEHALRRAIDLHPAFARRCGRPCRCARVDRPIRRG